MKTININLLGDQGKTPQTNKPEVLVLIGSDSINPQDKNTAVLLVVASVIVFSISLMIWSIFSFATNSMEKELNNLTKKSNEIQSKLVHNQKEINLKKNKKEILETKLLIKNQVKNDTLSWFRILKDISKIVPEQLKITEIVQESSRKRHEKQSLKIKGEVKASQQGVLRLISFFVLNINENLPLFSNIKNATIEEVKYNEKTKLYDFLIVTEINQNPVASPVINETNVISVKKQKVISLKSDKSMQTNIVASLSQKESEKVCDMPINMFNMPADEVFEIDAPN